MTSASNFGHSLYYDTVIKVLIGENRLEFLIASYLSIFLGHGVAPARLPMGLHKVWVYMVLAAAAIAAGCSSGDPQNSRRAPHSYDLLQLPGAEAGLVGVRLFPEDGEDSRWCVFRTWPTEVLHIVLDCKGQASQAFEFPAAAEGDLLLFGAAAAGDRLWLLTYDASENVPSGRTAGPVEESVAVQVFSASQPSAPTQIASNLQLGGFDHLVYAEAHVDGLTACAVRRCFSIAATGAIIEWPTANLRDYEFVEVHLERGVATAIMRLADDHVTGNPFLNSFHYALATLTPQGATLTAIPRDCLPAMAEVGSRPAWRCVRTRAEAAALQAHDIARMPNNGLIDFGASNLEGRMAWSQVYYLNGLMQLAGGKLPVLQAEHDWSALRGRLRAEMTLFARRVLSGPTGIASKRYSLERSPVTFALHAGRIARTLANAEVTGHASEEVRAARDLLNERLTLLEGFVEQPARLVVGAEAFETLVYARGSDFWCDGANVPYNYISGYVDGLLAGRVTTDAQRSKALMLMQPLLTLEQIDAPSVWRYWWALGAQGWSSADDVSTNTPSYAGNNGTSHITYRTMDAAALLELEAARPGSLNPQLVGNLRQLVVDGLLLPWVNQAIGFVDNPIELSEPATYRYGRSAAPWELQSQVWALEKRAQRAAY